MHSSIALENADMRMGLRGFHDPLSSSACGVQCIGLNDAPIR